MVHPEARRLGTPDAGVAASHVRGRGQDSLGPFLASLTRSALFEIGSKCMLSGAASSSEPSELTAWTPSLPPGVALDEAWPVHQQGLLRPPAARILEYLQSPRAHHLGSYIAPVFFQRRPQASGVAHSVLSLASGDTARTDSLVKTFQCTAQPWHSPAHSINICRASKR